MITTLNTSIINYVNVQNKITELKEEDRLSKSHTNCKEILDLNSHKNEIAMHNIKFIIIGGLMYCLSFFLLDPTFLTSDVITQKVIIIVSIIMTCLGYCNTFIHMSQEFNMAIIDI